MCPRTEEAYYACVRQLSEFYDQSPELLSPEQIRQYCIHPSRYVFKTATSNRLVPRLPDGRLRWNYGESKTGQDKFIALEPTALCAGGQCVGSEAGLRAKPSGCRRNDRPKQNEILAAR